jgi:hypothetical protein
MKTMSMKSVKMILSTRLPFRVYRELTVSKKDS